jgi:hypothetical protein
MVRRAAKQPADTLRWLYGVITTPAVTAVVVPPAPVALTAQVIVVPMSAVATVYLLVVPPTVAPLRNQRYANDAAFDQVPRLHVKVRDGRGVPLIVGAVITAGAAASALPALDAEVEPPRPVAVTTQDSTWPASAEAST